MIPKIMTIGRNTNQKRSECLTIMYAMIPPIRANIIKPVLMSLPPMQKYNKTSKICVYAGLLGY